MFLIGPGTWLLYESDKAENGREGRKGRGRKEGRDWVAKQGNEGSWKVKAGRGSTNTILRVMV